MAKFGRYDPRNKKSGRNKTNSMYKDIRIRMSDEHNQRKNWTKAALNTVFEPEKEDCDGYED
jgi:hypothetical protein